MTNEVEMNTATPERENVTDANVKANATTTEELKTLTACGHIYQVCRRRNIGPYGSPCTTFRLREVKGKVFYAWGTSSFSRRTFAEGTFVSVTYTENRGVLGRVYAKAIQLPQVEQDPDPIPATDATDATMLLATVCKDFGEFYKVAHRLLKDAKKLMTYVEEGLGNE